MDLTGTPRTTLVLGGARSGKSELAEALAASAPPPVTYVATGWASDDDMGERIARHRARRPAGWVTVELGATADLPSVLAGLEGSVLVDALGTWVAAAPGFAVDVAGLCDALVGREGRTVVVSDEVGLGVHPETELGRRFRDALGELNRAVSGVAGEVLVVVAGRVVPLGGLAGA